MPERVAELSISTFWFFLPSVPLFIALPLLLRSGVGFWLSDGDRASSGRWRSTPLMVLGGAAGLGIKL